MPAPASAIVVYAPPRARSQMMCRGSNGCLARRSISTKAVRSTGLATSATIVAVAVQEWVSALENP